MKRFWAVFLVLCAVMVMTCAAALADEYASCVFDSATGTLTVSGTGVVTDFSVDNALGNNARSAIQKVIIGDGVTSIGEGAFSYCSSLLRITIPNSVTSIGGSAFESCTILGSISIPNSVTSIGDYAFAVCSGLSEVTFLTGSQLTGIGMGAFSNCSRLSSITIPAGVTSIEADTFECCESLKSVELPKNLVNIGVYSFNGCGLKSVMIPAGVTSIDSQAFTRCGSLVEFQVAEGNQNYSADNNGILYNKEKTALVCCPITKTSVTIPATVTRIEDFAFYKSTITGIEIPGTVQSIGINAFSYCNEMTSIIINTGLTTIEDLAFSDCHYLVSITIPAGVTKVGAGAFACCDKLSTIQFAGTSTEWAKAGGAEKYHESPAQVSYYKKDVTFKVKSGSWDDGKATDVTVSLKDGYGAQKLASENIPQVGSKPDPNYKTGRWDTEPNATTDITKDTTYTYTYDPKDAITPTVTMANYAYGNTPSTPSVTGNTGNGAVTYYYNTTESNSGGTEWNPASPPSLDVGNYYMYAEVAESDSYASAKTATDQFEITEGTMTVSAGDVTVPYDGKDHGITVSVTVPADGYTVKYGTEEGTYDLDASPTIQDVDSLKVYYQVTAKNYATVTGSATVTIGENDDQKAAKAVIEQIEALPKAADVTLSDKDAIEAARKAYDALTEDQKKLIPPETLKKLTDAEEAYAKAAAEAVRKPISVTVTFRVVNGSWDDDKTKKDRVITLKGFEGDELLIPLDEIPDVGDSPDHGYTTGAWDVEPPLEKPVTKDVTYTYTYAEKRFDPMPVSPIDPGPQQPEQVTIGGMVYRLNHEKKTATVLGTANRNAKTVFIPASIELPMMNGEVRANGSVKYKVTEIAAKAFQGMEKLKQVTIGKNVTTIGAKAFYKCGKLKTLVIRTKHLTAETVGANAFGKTAKDMKVTCPKGRKKLYEEILRKKGIAKKATFK